MTQQNYRGDFSIVEKFYRDIDGAQQQVAVPEHIRIEYFTEPFGGMFIVERNGDSMKNCRMSDDGMSLVCYLALSRRQVGCGHLYKRVLEINSDPSYPDGVRIDPHPSRTDVVLIPGRSDEDNMTVVSETVLTELRYGYSAYSLAVANGFEGSLEDWLESLKMRASDLSQEDKENIVSETTFAKNSINELKILTSEDGSMFLVGFNKAGQEVCKAALSDLISLKEVYIGEAAPASPDFKVWINPGTNRIRYKTSDGSWQEIAIGFTEGGGSGSIDPTLLEGYTPLVRDFSDDFNNDFTN